MILQFLAPTWVEALSRNLENKYRAEVGNINMLDLMVSYWVDNDEYAIEFMNDIAADPVEIKAWVYSKGNDMYEDELIDLYTEQLM